MVPPKSKLKISRAEPLNHMTPDPGSWTTPLGGPDITQFVFMVLMFSSVFQGKEHDLRKNCDILNVFVLNILHQFC